jgi:hypothetical protein
MVGKRKIIPQLFSIALLRHHDGVVYVEKKNAHRTEPMGA